jgi:hypothetical protein
MSSPLGRLKPEIKVRWREALESQKYPQSNGRLKSVRGFCCLGVLGDLAVEDGVASWNENDLVVKNTNEVERAAFPLSLLEWAFGTVSCQTGFEAPGTTNFPYEAGVNARTCLTAQNDSGFTFPEISKLIEEHF